MSRRFRFVTIAVLLLGSIAMTQAAAQPAQVVPRAYLPIVLRPITGAITFGAAIDSNGIPTPPATQFTAGLRKLYYNAAIGNADGLPYRLEWTLNGTRQPGIDESGTAVGNAENVNGFICYTQQGTSCDNPTGTLPTGTYTLRLYVNDILLAENTATIVPGQQLSAPSQGALHLAH
ncbi:MAG TPA: hypothetical protein VFX76_09055 [Roseiflexaceae bacterium]|nr:hypothetical protein [Roseiflexaceae bacterium]